MGRVLAGPVTASPEARGLIRLQAPGLWPGIGRACRLPRLCGILAL